MFQILRIFGHNVYIKFQNLVSTHLFSLKDLIKISALFLCLYVILNLLLNVLHHFIIPSSDIPPSWPISIFNLRVPSSLYPLFMPLLSSAKFQFTLSNMFIVFIYAIIFFFLLKYLNLLKKPSTIYTVAIVTVLLSNLIQGVYNGIIEPVSGGSGIQYYHDAIKINNGLTFLSNYNVLQSNLLCHSQTHPPGAVLTYYFLNQVFSSPSFISIVLMTVSLLSVFYIYKIVKIEFNEDIAPFVSLIFIFLPATQIYYLSSLDSLIALTFLATLYHYLRWRKRHNLFDYAIFTAYFFMSSFLTYIAVFLAGLIILDSFKQDKNLNNIIKLFIPLFIIFAGFYIFLDFNYALGFMTASHLQNPNGFYLLSNPISYLTTRFENIAEILLFFSPVAILLAHRGLKNRTNKMVQFSKSAILVLLIMFLAGVYDTGETARICLFIYPLLLLPIAYYINSTENVKMYRKKQVLLVLWIQSTLMQMVGHYFW